jgi:hypothetical protein
MPLAITIDFEPWSVDPPRYISITIPTAARPVSSASTSAGWGVDPRTFVKRRVADPGRSRYGGRHAYATHVLLWSFPVMGGSAGSRFHRAELLWTCQDGVVSCTHRVQLEVGHEIAVTVCDDLVWSRVFPDRDSAIGEAERIRQLFCE